MINLYIIGLGLYDEKDISVRAYEIVQQCSRVYLEGYTSILTSNVTKLEAFYKRDIIYCDREFVESKFIKEIIKLSNTSKTTDIALLIVGDPFIATTHNTLLVDAWGYRDIIKVNVLHNASVISVIGRLGPISYNYGLTVSIPFFDPIDSNQVVRTPNSWYDRILFNYNNGLHTLCLLDIRVHERTPENILYDKSIYEPPRYMTILEACEQIIQVTHDRQKLNDSQTKLFKDVNSLLVIGVARLGNPDDELIIAGTIDQLLHSKIDFGAPLHSLVIPSTSNLNTVELEILNIYKIKS